MAMDEKTYKESVMGITAKQLYARHHHHGITVKIYTEQDKIRCKNRFHNCKVDFVSAELAKLAKLEGDGIRRYVMWIDTDSYILKPHVRVESFIRLGQSKDLILTDHNVNINNGVFFLRASPWSKKFVERWRNQIYRPGVPEWPFLDQGAMWEVILRTITPRTEHRYLYNCTKEFSSQDLERCFNGELERLGYPYPHGTTDAHIAFVSSLTTTGGFNSHVCKDSPHFNNWKWLPEVCHTLGKSFMIHSKEAAVYAKESLKALCNVTANIQDAKARLQCEKSSS